MRLGGNLVSLQEKEGDDQHSHRLPSDSKVAASGLGEWQILGKFHCGESLSYYLQTRIGTPRRQGMLVTEPLKLPGLGSPLQKTNQKQKKPKAHPG